MMFKILEEHCTPTRKSEHYTGFDLYAREDVVIDVGNTKAIPLGVKIDKSHFYDGVDNTSLCMRQKAILLEEIMKSHYLGLFISDSLTSKGLLNTNGHSIVDLDYTDEIELVVTNHFNTRGISNDSLLEKIREYDKKDVSKAHSVLDFLIRDTIEIKKGQLVSRCVLLEHKSYLM